jgi:glycosyltransferase involved in cell wall biosynthesis
MARLLGMRCLLDLEDGYAECKYIMRNALNALLSKLYARLCSGAMLAAHVLKRETPLRRSYVCYGIAEVVKVDRDWSSTPLQILMGGSLLKETGAELFLETIYLMMHQHPLTLAKLRFVATGFGDCAEVLRKAASGDLRHCLSFRGRLTAGEYRDIMRESHVGLCLKLPQSSMGMTTFPSKVVELASYGLLVVSTRISDVPQIFDDCTAILLDAATPEALCKALIGASQKPEKAKATALAGQARVASLCSEEKVGAELWRFWRES